MAKALQRAATAAALVTIGVGIGSGAAFAATGSNSYSHCETAPGYNLACAKGQLGINTSRIYDHTNYWDAHPSNKDSVYTRSNFQFYVSAYGSTGWEDEGNYNTADTKSTTPIYANKHYDLETDGDKARATNYACEDEYLVPDDCSSPAIYTSAY